MHDGQRGGPELALPVQNGDNGIRWFEGMGNYRKCERPLIGADSPTISPDSPVVLPLKVLYSYPGSADRGPGTPRPGVAGHLFQRLRQANPPAVYEMFARTGFDARRDIAGIILNRWDYAYLNPQPVFLRRGRETCPERNSAGCPLRAYRVREHRFGRNMDHRSSILEAERASRSVVGPGSGRLGESPGAVEAVFGR